MSFRFRICCALFATPFGYTLLTATVFESLILAWLSKGGGNCEWSFDWNLSALGVAGIYLLVTVNTFLFVRHLSPILSPMLQSSAFTVAEKKTAKSLFNKQYNAFYFGALLSAAIVALVLAAWSGVFRESSRLGQWANVVHYSEYASCLIFFLFCYADWNALKACRLAIRKRCTNCGDIKAIEDEANDIEKFILAVDGPGFLGLVAIVIISDLIFPYAQADLHKASIPFWLGFSAGATTLHIAFSQASMTFLQASHRLLPLRCRNTMFIVGILKVRRVFRSVKSWWR